MRVSALQGGVLQQQLVAHSQPRTHLTEQASRLYLVMRRRFRRTTGAEFVSTWRKRLRLSFWLWRKGLFEIVQHGDVTASGLEDGALDAVLSPGVLEHVPDARSAFSELARVIRRGGVLVMTIPFYEDALQSTQIATLSAAGTVEFVGEPEYHGNPLGSGVPCFHHFGWALLQDLRDAGFNDAAAHRVSDVTRGLPHGIWVIVANR